MRAAVTAGASLAHAEKGLRTTTTTASCIVRVSERSRFRTSVCDGAVVVAAAASASTIYIRHPEVQRMLEHTHPAARVEQPPHAVDACTRRHESQVQATTVVVHSSTI